MKLYISPTSPYARLVRVALVEKELTERVEYVFVDPWASPAELLAVNPACRVPTLVTDGGEALTEAGVIVLYLERRYPEPRLMARDNVERVHAQLGSALSCLNSGVGAFLQRRFGEPGSMLETRWAASLQRGAEGLVAAVDTSRMGDPDLGNLAIAVALDWLDYRFPEEVNWRAGAADVAAWADRLLARPAFLDTQPPPA